MVIWWDTIKIQLDLHVCQYYRIVLDRNECPPVPSLVYHQQTQLNLVIAMRLGDGQTWHRRCGLQEVDAWLATFIDTHPTLKTKGQFHKERARLTNLDLQRTCNFYVPSWFTDRGLKCWVIPPGVGAKATFPTHISFCPPSLTSTTIWKWIKWKYATRTKHWASLFRKSKANLGSSVLQSYMKNPAPKSYLLLAGTAFGAIPEVDQYIGDIVLALSNFIVTHWAQWTTLYDHTENKKVRICVFSYSDIWRM